MKLQCLDHVALTVTDVGRSIVWYQDVLGLLRLHESAWGDRPAVLGAGTTGLALFRSDVERPAAPPGRDVLAMRHLAFRTDRAGFEASQAELRGRGIGFDFEDHGIAHSIYLHDPDGHRVEITTYEV